MNNPDRQAFHEEREAARAAASRRDASSFAIARQVDAAAIELDRRARELPDTLFDADPEVQRLRADLQAREQLAQKVARGLPAGEAAELVQRLRARATQAKADLRTAALEDALDGDEEFHRSVVQARHVEHLHRALAAAESAAAVLSRSPRERMPEFEEQVSQARLALKACLTQRKRAHLQQVEQGHARRAAEAAAQEAEA